MIKHFNSEKVFISLFITLIFTFLVFFNLIYYILLEFLKDPENFQYDFFNFIFISIWVAFLVNNFLHTAMESNFKIKEQDEYFEYKTLMRRREKIYYRKIKKFIICKENLVFKGEYEALIIVRKGLKRSLFFQEYSMRKQDYTKLKEIFLSKDVKVIYKKSKLFKPLATLFYF